MTTTLVLLASVLWVQSVLACKCVESTLDERFTRSTAVFIGTAIAQESTRGDNAVFTFRVHEPWKGVKQNRVVVATRGNEGTCGFPFKVGERYLIYANGSREGDPRVETGLCSGTMSLSQAGEVLAQLGPASVKFTEDAAPSFLWLSVAVVVGAVVGGAVMAWWIFRRRTNTTERVRPDDR